MLGSSATPYVWFYLFAPIQIACQQHKRNHPVTHVWFCEIIQPRALMQGHKFRPNHSRLKAIHDQVPNRL
jgi:hypothetical protein